jgi:hypothetical protein
MAYQRTNYLGDSLIIEVYFSQNLLDKNKQRAVRIDFMGADSSYRAYRCQVKDTEEYESNILNTSRSFIVEHLYLGAGYAAVSGAEIRLVEQCNRVFNPLLLYTIL